MSGFFIIIGTLAFVVFLVLLVVMKIVNNLFSHLRQHGTLLSILALAIILRIAVIGLVHSAQYGSDEREYIGIAHHLAQYGDFVDSNGDYAIRAPLFPFVLSWIFRIFGPGLTMAHFFGCLIGTGNVFLVYLLCSLVWKNNRIAYIASGVFAFYPGMIIYSGLLQNETIYVFFFLLAFIFGIQLLRTPAVLPAALLGIVSALATLTRPVFFGFFPLLLLMLWWISYREKQKNIQFLLIALFFWCIVLSPWTIRNYHLFNKVIPVSSGGGNSLLTGNNPYATGTWHVREGFDQWYKESAVEHGISNIEQFNEAQRSEFSRVLALEFISSHPAKTLELILKKVHIFWIYPIVHSDSYIPVQLLAVLFDFLLLVVVSVGIVTMPKPHLEQALFVAAILFFFFVQIILHAESRFRLPLIAFFCFYSGWGVQTLLDKKRIVSLFQSKKVRTGLILLIAIIVLIYGYTGLMFAGGRI